MPITTSGYSPQSNGLAEAFVKTFKRDYVDGAELRDAELVLAQLSTWFEDYNTRAVLTVWFGRPRTPPWPWENPPGRRLPATSDRKHLRGFRLD